MLQGVVERHLRDAREDLLHGPGVAKIVDWEAPILKSQVFDTLEAADGGEPGLLDVDHRSVGLLVRIGEAVEEPAGAHRVAHSAAGGEAVHARRVGAQQPRRRHAVECGHEGTERLNTLPLRCRRGGEQRGTGSERPNLLGPTGRLGVGEVAAGGYDDVAV